MNRLLFPVCIFGVLSVGFTAPVIAAEPDQIQIPIALLGSKKEEIRKFVEFDEDCIADIDRAVVVMGHAAANKLVPFLVGEGQHIELEFDSCSSQGAVLSLTMPISRDKFNNLKKLYTVQYGKPITITHKNDLLWNLRKGSISLEKVTSDNYVFSISLENHPLLEGDLANPNDTDNLESD